MAQPINDLCQPIRIGLLIKPQHADQTAIRRAASQAENLGWTSSTTGITSTRWPASRTARPSSAGPCSVPERRRARRRRRSAQTATWPISNASVGIKRDPDLHRPQLHELGITHFTLAPTRRTTTWPTWTPGSNGTTGRTPGTRLHAAMTSVGRGHGRPAAV